MGGKPFLQYYTCQLLGAGAAWPTGRPGNFPVGTKDFLPGGPHLTLEFPSTFETTLKDKNTSQDALILDVFVVCYQIERDVFVERGM